MRRGSNFKGISGNLGACCIYYLAILLLGRLYPWHLLPLLCGGIVLWTLMPYTELFLQRMTRPIRRAMPTRRERIVITSALVRTKSQ